MTTLTTAQLLGMTRLREDKAPPAGFSAVPVDLLFLPRELQDVRINYKVFFNATTKELVITGTPRAMPRLDLVTQKKIEDSNIFSDTVRVIHGPRAGGFTGPSDPAIQTEALVRKLTADKDSPYPNATVSFAAEGAVGLAFSAASHALRTGSQGSVRVGSTVTLNAWTGRWTPDGSVDTGVLDVRTPHPANGDPGIGSLRVGLQPWAPGGVVAAVDTGDALRAGGLADIGTQGAVALAELVVGKAGGRFLGEGAAWVTEKLVGKGAEAVKPHAVDALASAAAQRVDSPDRAVAALGWQAQLTPADTAQVIREGIGQGQWNVMQGRSPAGHAVGGTFYEHTGKPLTVGTGPGAEIRQPATQVTTWRDETTGAVMEARVSGLRMDDRFQADTLGAYAIGMDTAGRMVLKDQAAQRVADFQLRPAASTRPERAAAQDAAASAVVVEGRSGLAAYTTVSIQTHANGATSFDFVGEDGSRAWVMHDVQTGHRQVAVSSAQALEGEPRTVLYELDRHSHRVGPERYLDAVGMPVDERSQQPRASQAAPAPSVAQPEPVPSITTHEQRITPTPGGISFAEAHKRRDEPEQISAGSLQTVGKLDASTLIKGSLSYRMHQANEQDLMRALSLAQTQDRERFKDEPIPLRPSLDRTQERVQERQLDPATAHKQPVPSAPEVKAPAPLRSEQTMAPVIHAPAPGHVSVASSTIPTSAHSSASAPVQPIHAVEHRATAPAPSQPLADPAAASALAAAQAEAAASQAQLAEMRQQMARMQEQHRQNDLVLRNERDEREQREAAQVAQNHDTRQHMSATPGLDDPRHARNPHHALFNQLKERIPEASDRRLLEFTAACHANRITDEGLGRIHFDRQGGHMIFTSSWPPCAPAVVDLKNPSPDPSESIQAIQQTEQQRTMMSEMRAREAAQVNQQQGPVMGWA